MGITRLTFITSNAIKLAHARYICNDYSVEIVQHKKIYYGIGYNEPRINNRDDLLKSSIEDAILRWKKNASEQQFFFIEDTSVVIDALSTEENEVPGVDVKYWMKDMTFEQLDASLKERGNNRKATVFSHVILFLTKNLQEEGKPPYIVFKNCTHGSIVTMETDFETNILYPWLDNKSFNKWFVPNGYDKPISQLNIEEANKVDFRRKSILQMLNYLENKKQISQCKGVAPEFTPTLDFKERFIVCGPTCAGKSTMGQYLLDKYGYYHLEASDFMSLCYYETCGTTFKIDKNLFAAKLLKINPIVVVQRLCRYMQVHKIYNHFVITGFRNKEEIYTFIQLCPVEHSNIFYIDAEYQRRYKRWINRRRDNIEYSENEFMNINTIQQEMGVNDIAQIDSIQVISNNSNDVNEYYNDINSIFKKDKMALPFNLISVKDVTKIGLENAILIALMQKYSDNSYYTTTEIAHLINNFFAYIKKNKNNISRYFNQSYYPYYEIKKESDGTLKYKLSPTGYSESILVINRLLNINNY